MKQRFELTVERIKDRNIKTDQAEFMRLIDEAISTIRASTKTPPG